MNSISENEDSIREGFRRNLLASSTPAVRAFGAVGKIQDQFTFFLSSRLSS